MRFAGDETMAAVDPHDDKTDALDESPDASAFGSHLHQP